MSSVFEQPPAPVDELTWKTRVQRFWEWFAAEAARIHGAASRQTARMTDEMCRMMEQLMPRFAWEFGAEQGGSRYSFVLSGEGDPHRQLLTIYWRDQAPSLEGWSFFPARQPGAIPGLRIRTGEQVFDPIGLWLTPFVDPERKKVDLAIWHPLFAKLEKEDRLRCTFLCLDGVLGEYATQQRIGELRFTQDHLGDAMPLSELPSFVQRIEAESGWEQDLPGESSIVYQCEEPPHGFPRDDLIVGSTCQPALIKDYLAAAGQLDDPLAGTGADYVYVSFETEKLPTRRQHKIREAVENALDHSLSAAQSGRIIGGAFGRQFTYVDLLLFDGRASLEIVQRVLREQGLPAGTTINFFAREKRHRRWML